MSKIKELEKKLFDDYGYNEPILTRDINALEEYGIEQSLLLKYLSRLNEEDRIQKFDTGVYYFAEKSKVFNNYRPLPVEKVIERKFIKNDEEVYGYPTGYAFANPLGLTTQVPMVKQVVTEKISKNQSSSKQERFSLTKSKTDINKDNVKFLQVLDLIYYYQNIIETDEETTKKRLYEYISDVSLDETTIKKILSSYPAKATQMLILSGYLDLLNQIREKKSHVSI